MLSKLAANGCFFTIIGHLLVPLAPQHTVKARTRTVRLLRHRPEQKPLDCAQSAQPHDGFSGRPERKPLTLQACNITAHGPLDNHCASNWKLTGSSAASTHGQGQNKNCVASQAPARTEAPFTAHCQHNHMTASQAWPERKPLDCAQHPQHLQWLCRHPT